MNDIVRYRRLDRVKALRSVILMGTALWLVTMSDVAMAGLIGTAHDFATGDGCASCHALHKPSGSGGPGPLWDHETTTATFTLYSSDTLDAIINDPTDFGSKLCLSCHDGTVAIDSFGGVTGTDFNYRTKYARNRFV